MLRLLPRRGRLPLVFALLLALLGAAVPAAAQPTAAQTPLAATPTALSVMIPLGQKLTRTIALANTSGTPITPAIYEALPAAAPSLSASAGQATGPRRVPLPHQAERIDPRLASSLAHAPDGRGEFLVYLREQADLSAAYSIADWRARGRYVYQALAGWADASQRGLRDQLSARGATYRPFWVVNAVLVHGTIADAQAIAGRADVALVRANHTTALPLEPPGLASTTDRCSPDQPGNPVCWNIRKLGVDRVWRDFGVTGRGVVVASIDTGVSYSHPALAAQYRGYLGPDRYEHDYNWFDPQGSLAAPTDTNGHGTHTMGTIVAASDGTSSHPAVGLAPGARWIAAQGCEAFFCSESDLIESAQWMLAPTTLVGSDPRPDLRPMIVNNSWAGPGGDDWYAGYTAAWRAAGIFPVFAAGNAGSDVLQGCGSIDSPADYADVVAVGATDAADQIASFSLFGPSIDGLLKPDLVAPGTYLDGQGLLSTGISGDGYRTLQGTSMAAPHLAGLVALLWSANPALIGDYDATYAILRDTARHLSDTRCGDPSGAPNNIYGHGRVDAYAAIARARIDLPWLGAPAALQPLAAGGQTSFAVTLDAARVPGPGTYRARLQIFGADLGQTPTSIAVTLTVTPAAQQATLTGRVVSADTGAPLQASVGPQGGASVPTAADGTYTLTLALGSYDLVASALSFLPGHRALNLTGDLRLPDLALQPDQPQIAVPTATLSASVSLAERRTLVIPLANSGTRALNYTVRVAPDYYSVWRGDEPGGPAYNWIDLPPGSPELKLGRNVYHDHVPLGIDFPFFSYSYTETLVTSSGTLAFGDPLGYVGPSSRCLPADEIFFYLIAPFRADLDPSRGGHIRYGTSIDRQTFILSYEDVPLHDGPASDGYTFQVLLHEDGRIGFQYQKLAPLPSQLSVGLQRAPLEIEQLGCGTTAPIYPGLAIELRPQPPATAWLSSDDLAGELAPGEQRSLRLQLTWVRPNTPWPYRGKIEIRSSDPIRSLVAVPIEARMRPAPYEQALPFVPFGS